MIRHIHVNMQFILFPLHTGKKFKTTTQEGIHESALATPAWQKEQPCPEGSSVTNFPFFFLLCFLLFSATFLNLQKSGVKPQLAWPCQCSQMDLCKYYDNTQREDSKLGQLSVRTTKYWYWAPRIIYCVYCRYNMSKHCDTMQNPAYINVSSWEEKKRKSTSILSHYGKIARALPTSINF